MKENTADYQTLRKLAEYEDSMAPDHRPYGWEWFDVGVHPSTLNRFLVNRWVKVIYRSTKHTNFLLTDVGRSIAASLTEEEAPAEQPKLDVSGLFKCIIGYDDLKELLRESLQLDKPIHVLLWGPPSIAKTLFLLDIEKAGGDAAMWIIGSATSKAGLWDVVAERRPRWLLVDELDKMNMVDQTALLSLMERGRIVRTKVGRELDETINCWVIATANRIAKLPAELLSRFAVYQLGQYTPDEYREVVKSVLVSQESIPEQDATEIVDKLVNRTHDVRDAIRVARLSKRVGVSRAVELLIKP